MNQGRLACCKMSPVCLLTMLLLAFPPGCVAPNCYDGGELIECGFFEFCGLTLHGFSRCMGTYTVVLRNGSEISYPNTETLECIVVEGSFLGYCACLNGPKCKNAVDQSLFDTICTSPSIWKKDTPICKRKLAKCRKGWSGATETCERYDQSCILRYPDGPMGCGRSDYWQNEHRTICKENQCYCNDDDCNDMTNSDLESVSFKMPKLMPACEANSPKARNPICMFWRDRKCLNGSNVEICPKSTDKVLCSIDGSTGKGTGCVSAADTTACPNINGCDGKKCCCTAGDESCYTDKFKKTHVCGSSPHTPGCSDMKCLDTSGRTVTCPAAVFPEKVVCKINVATGTPEGCVSKEACTKDCTGGKCCCQASDQPCNTENFLLQQVCPLNLATPGCPGVTTTMATTTESPVTTGSNEPTGPTKNSAQTWSGHKMKPAGKLAFWMVALLFGVICIGPE